MKNTKLTIAVLLPFLLISTAKAQPKASVKTSDSLITAPYVSLYEKGMYFFCEPTSTVYDLLTRRGEEIADAIMIKNTIEGNSTGKGGGKVLALKYNDGERKTIKNIFPFWISEPSDLTLYPTNFIYSSDYVKDAIALCRHQNLYYSYYADKMEELPLLEYPDSLLVRVFIWRNGYPKIIRIRMLTDSTVFISKDALFSSANGIRLGVCKQKTHPNKSIKEFWEKIEHINLDSTPSFCTVKADEILLMEIKKGDNYNLFIRSKKCPYDKPSTKFKKLLAFIEKLAN